MPYMSLFFKDSFTLNTDFNPDVIFFKTFSLLRQNISQLINLGFLKKKALTKSHFQNYILTLKTRPKKSNVLRVNYTEGR